MKCRICSNSFLSEFINLGSTPISNDLVDVDELGFEDKEYPLEAFFCDKCYLVQIDKVKSEEKMFKEDYVYFSSTSKSWLKHSEDFAIDSISKFKLNSGSLVIEVASNDGYLLQYYKNKNIPCIGIEPTLSTAKVSSDKGIKTVTKFLNLETAKELYDKNLVADLLIGNNVLAHVPDLNNFVSSLKILLKKTGILSLEFPYLKNLVEKLQFDTIYHEHFSYFSFLCVKGLFEKHELEIFDVKQIPTHGGSLRIFVKHNSNRNFEISSSVSLLLNEEKEAGINSKEYYENFTNDVFNLKKKFREFIFDAKSNSKKIAAYGAAAKGNTFLNFNGITNREIDYVVDDTPFKQGKFLPKSRIPIVPVEKLRETKPDIILILPWNFKKEIASKLNFTKEWGAKVLVAVPDLEFIS